MNKKLKIILLVFICIITGAVAAYLYIHKPHLNIKDAVPTTTISAVELYTGFLKDSVTAKTKYTNMVIEVSGEVTQVSKNQLNQVIVFLKTAMPDAAINCTMEGNAENIKPGATVSIKGICSGYNSGDADMGIPGDVLMIRCYSTN